MNKYISVYIKASGANISVSRKLLLINLDLKRKSIYCLLSNKCTHLCISTEIVCIQILKKCDLPIPILDNVALLDIQKRTIHNGKRSTHQ